MTRQGNTIESRPIRHELILCCSILKDNMKSGQLTPLPNDAVGSILEVRCGAWPSGLPHMIPTGYDQAAPLTVPKPMESVQPCQGYPCSMSRATGTCISVTRSAEQRVHAEAHVHSTLQPLRWKVSLRGNLL